MNNAENKRINWLRIIRPIALALVLVFLLSYATYSWMRRDWTPKVHQENVKIQAGSSLTFRFAGEECDDIAVNTLLDMKQFVFKSVSNATGDSDDFFTLDYSTRGSFYDTFHHINEEDILEETLKNFDNKYTAYGYQYGYIELQFHISSADEGDKFDKNIFLKGSYINGVVDENDSDVTALNNKASRATRISVTVHGTGIEGDKEQYDVTHVFAKAQVDENGNILTDENGDPILTRLHSGITDEIVDDKYAAHGVERYSSVNPPVKTEYIYPKNGSPIQLLKSQTVQTFEALGEKPIFVLKQGTTRAITVRIWLEGEDPDCEDEIAGSALDLLVKFSAQDIYN